MLRIGMRSKPLIAIVVALACGGAAIAATSSSGALHACANKRTGALRLLTHGKCKHSEREASWNAVGPAGKPGPRGPAGLQGSVGVTGVTGATGTARAYAHVIADGSPTNSHPSLDPARTKGFTEVGYGTGGANDGEYCLTAPGISSDSTAAVVSVDYNVGYAGTPYYAYLYVSHPDCAAGQFEVITIGNTAVHNLDFEIVVP
jgi:hypothetical protein